MADTGYRQRHRCARVTIGRRFFLLGVGRPAPIVRLPIFLPVMTGTAALLLLLGTVHLSGSCLYVACTNSCGRKNDRCNAFDRGGSFLWRMSQTPRPDELAEHPVAGSARWDWWRLGSGPGVRPCC